MTQVTLRGAQKRFGDVQVIHGVDLDISDGEFCVFVGPSGCGKSTLLRMIAGLEDVTEGEIKIGDMVVNDVDPAARGVAMVFQTYALYPHMTVEENMGFGLRMTGWSKDDIEERVQNAASDSYSWRIFSSASPRPCPAANANVSPSVAPSSALPRCFCSTSPSPTWTPNSASP